jgi:predicted RNase H-like HicB family nuclease
VRIRYTAVIQRDGKWYIAFCPEVPKANGQGKTRQECLENLCAAIELVLEYRREGGEHSLWLNPSTGAVGLCRATLR